MIGNRGKLKTYAPELVERALCLAEEIGPTRAATVLGLAPTMISTWQRRKRDGKYMSENDTPEQKALVEARRELQKLKRENSDLKKANVILKELASFFTKDHPLTSSEWSVNSLEKGLKKGSK